MSSLHKPKGVTRVELVVIVCASLFLAVCIIMPCLARLRQIAFRMSCAHNLSAIGKAMLTYANDQQGALPRAGGRASFWGGPILWNAPDRTRAFQMASDGSGGRATISSSLYLPVKYGYISPEVFVCKADAGTTRFDLAGSDNLPKGFKLADAWDFGPNGYRHCSYAYHAPYGLFPLTTSCEPGMAVAADRNPWIPSPAADAMDFSQFKPDSAPYNGSVAQGRQGNAIAHQEDGQNVLFLDGHAAFQKRSYCGVDQDNIYLVADRVDGGSLVGVIPSAIVSPSNRKDSVLVHDPPDYIPLPYRATTTHEARDIDSRNLKQTAVVATLDCPLPEHKNVIWCSTFQMAWDKFKQDIIREPIQVGGAEELANRLNRAQFPAGNIEEKSYYAAAGFVKSGIIEQIQKGMSRRFPSEPRPVFDERYRKLPGVAVAYAYLNVDVGFAHPYYSYDGAFRFDDSNGTRAEVTAFCAQNAVRAANHEQVRGQVEVLYDNQADSPETTEFAVDLCRDTKPYQVVLARVPRSNTLGEAARSVGDKIAQFKNDPNYKTLRAVRPADTLIVPDVLYKLTHHFEELLGKQVTNMGGPEPTLIFEAMQRIDFTLSRTGVVLKSEARFATTTKSRDLDTPRHLHFDRPFLIYVKKREADATPFFIMWVDNAELMKRY